MRRGWDILVRNVIKQNYRWLVWGIMSVAYIVVFFHRMAIGIVKEDLIHAFGISATTFANLGSIYFYAYMIMQIPTGILADTLGVRKTVTYGTLLAGIGSIIFGLAPEIRLAFLGRLLVGLGVSVIFICILKFLSQWFQTKEFASMTGLTSFMGNLGGIMAQTPLALMVAAFTWRKIFFSIGLITIIVAIFCYLILCDQPENKNNSTIRTNTEQNVKSEKMASLGICFKQALKNWQTWPPVIIIMGIYGSFICFTGTWGISYLMDVYGFPKEGAANFTLVSIIGFMLGSIVINTLSDQIRSRKKPMLIFGFLYMVTWGILVFYNGGEPPQSILYPLLFIMGFCGSTYYLTFAVVKEVNNPQIAGITTAIVNTGGFLGAAILPALMGNYFDRVNSTPMLVNVYHNALLYPFIAILISTIFILFVKETAGRNIWKA